MSEASRNAHIDTRLIHAGQAPDPLTGAIVPPIYTASTFVQTGIGRNLGFKYSRIANPTRAALETTLADIEGAAAAFAFPTGLSAAATLLETLSAGAHVLAHTNLYGGIHRLLTEIRTRSAGLRVSFVDFTKPDEIRAAIAADTRMLWFETPSNPLLDIIDLAVVARIGRERGVLTVCDSTFASPCGQLPLQLGVDVVVHSATKFLSGHSDLLAGVVAVSRNAPEGLGEQLGYLQNAVGAVLAPTECALLSRSLKTLSVRIERQFASAARIATWLEANRSRLGIAKVLYPGLPGHPGHDLARRQMKGFGALISLVLEGPLSRVEQVLTTTRLFAFAVSLGGVESLIQHPGSLTHKSVPDEHRKKSGLGDNLVRLSVGLEHPDDLIADLDEALRASGS